MKKLIPIFLLFSNIIFAVNFEADLYASAGLQYTIYKGFEQNPAIIFLIYGLSLFYNFGLKTKIIEKSIKMSGIGISIFAGISFGRPK